jgi:ABC-2 type transport system ATP-binding protein
MSFYIYYFIRQTKLYPKKRMMIKLNQIEKCYSVKKVLDKISLSIQTDSIYCLLGKNGAGKTTLINILSDLIAPDSGEILFDKLKYSSNELEIKRNLGVLSETNFLIEELSGYEYLTFLGKLYNLSKDSLTERINSLANYFFDDPNDINKTISKYSAGMKKKLMFCAAVLHTPDILLLDEPFSGLDPVAANLLVEFLNKYRNDKRIIFLSSHNLNYIELVATHIGILDEGKIIFNDTFNSFVENGRKKINESLLSKIEKTHSKINEVEWAF